MLTIRELIKTLYNAFNQKLKSHRGNWEQNDPTADDYIKNRPFYTDGYTKIIKEITFTAPESYYWCSPFVFELKEGEAYNVTWNGKEYECIVKLDGEYAYIGNLGMMGEGVNTGEPFFFFYLDYGDGDIEYALVVKNAGTHTVSVSKQNVVKIDSKYLDIQIPEVPEGASIGVKGAGAYAEAFNNCGSNNASGQFSHAEGNNSYATGTNSHAEGGGTTASGESSHAEGSYSKATMHSAHAEGYYTEANGNYSHAEGSGTIAKGDSSHVQGKYNIEDTSNKYAHIVGNGYSSSRSNAHTLDWNGNAWFKGDVYIGGTNQSEGEKLAKISELPKILNDNIVNGTADGSLRAVYSKAENDTYKLGVGAISSGNSTSSPGEYSFSGGIGSEALGSYSTAFGCFTTAQTYSEFVIGRYNAKEEGLVFSIDSSSGWVGNPSLYGEEICYKITGTPLFNENTGIFTFEELTETKYNKLEAGDLIAWENSITSSSYHKYTGQNYMGYSFTTYKALSPSEKNGKYSFMVGNGEYNARSNAHTLDWNGLGWFAGGLKVGGTGMDDENAVEVATKTDLNVIKAEMVAAKNSILLKDQVNGYNYIIFMQNGSLTSRCATKSIEVTTMPINTEYIAGEYLDPTGMTVIATAYDGSTYDVTNYIDLTNYLVEGDIAEIIYVEAGITHTTTIPVTVNPFDPTTVLVDFTYNINNDGTYKIINWNQTLNGVSDSTTLVVPNNGLITI